MDDYTSQRLCDLLYPCKPKKACAIISAGFSHGKRSCAQCEFRTIECLQHSQSGLSYGHG